MMPHLRAAGLFLGCAAIAAAAPNNAAIELATTEPFPWLWLLVALNALPLALKLPVGIAHTVLCLAVLRDHPPTPPRFAPKYVWALATLLAGFAGLCAYWLLHHANPTSPDQRTSP